MNHFSFAGKIALVFASAVLLGAGCININFGKTSGSDGGMWISLDRGTSWEQKALIEVDAKNRATTIAGLDVDNLDFHPTNKDIIMLGSHTSGLWLSMNKGGNWENIFPLKSKISVFAADPSTTSVYYAALGANIYKTGDAGKSDWKLVYQQGVPGQIITALAVDPSSTSTLYAATSGGNMLVSGDYGLTWQNLHNFDNSIIDLYVNPKEPSRIFVATQSKGLMRSVDRGATWENTTEDLQKTYPGSNKIKNISITRTSPETIIYKVDAYLLRSFDGGNTWGTVPLLSAPNTYQMRTLTVSDSNSEGIYFTTASNLYRSLNGGAEWQTLPLPSKRLPTALRVDSSDSSVIIYGAANPPKKSGLF